MDIHTIYQSSRNFYLMLYEHIIFKYKHNILQINRNQNFDVLLRLLYHYLYLGQTHHGTFILRFIFPCRHSAFFWRSPHPAIFHLKMKKKICIKVHTKAWAFWISRSKLWYNCFLLIGPFCWNFFQTNKYTGFMLHS